MPEFVSERITPIAGGFDTRSMARGEPGLPRGFRWRGDDYPVLELLETWKQSSREGAHAQGELYLRRHYFRVRVSDAEWIVYFTRQPSRSGSPKSRWFLYERRAGPQAAP